VFTVNRVTDLPYGVETLVAIALDEGHGMVLRLVEDFRSGRNRFDKIGEALWAVHAGPALVGVCGLNRDPFASPDERAGRVRRLYVMPEWRRLGVATALLSDVIAMARDNFATLTAFTTAHTAGAFYRAHGFEPVTGVARRSFEMRLGPPV
jgi:GNAT superfamily N-acetyltransferase